MFQPLDSIFYMVSTLIITNYGYFYYWILIECCLISAVIVLSRVETVRNDKQALISEGIEYIKLE